MHPCIGLHFHQLIENGRSRGRKNRSEEGMEQGDPRESPPSLRRDEVAETGRHHDEHAEARLGQHHEI